MAVPNLGGLPCRDQERTRYRSRPRASAVEAALLYYLLTSATEAVLKGDSDRYELPPTSR